MHDQFIMMKLKQGTVKYIYMMQKVNSQTPSGGGRDLFVHMEYSNGWF